MCCAGETQRGNAIKWRSKKYHDQPLWRPLNCALSLRRHYVFWLWTKKVCAIYFVKNNTSFEASCSSSWRPKLERPWLLRLNQATVSKKRFKTKKASRGGINNVSSSPGNNFKQLQHPKRVNTSPCSSPERWMQIFVKILAEKTISLEVEPSDHITRSWNESNHWKAWNEVTMKRSDRKASKTKSLSRDNSLLVASLTSSELVVKHSLNLDFPIQPVSYTT